MSAREVRGAVGRGLKIAGTALSGAVVVLALTAVSAVAATTNWSVEAKAGTTYLTPGSNNSYEVLARNVSPASIGQATVTDVLPAGTTFKSVALYWSGFPKEGNGSEQDLNKLIPVCPEPTGQTVTCSVPEFLLEGINPEDPGVLPGETVRMVVGFTLSPSIAEGPLADEASVEGGGTSASTTVNSTVTTHPKFGLAHFTLEPTEKTEEVLLVEEGSHAHGSYEFINKPYSTPFTQAGGHPWGLTTTGEFATEMGPKGIPVPVHDVKDLITDLPPGLLGDPMAVPRCPLAQVTGGGALCPADTQIGYYRVQDFGYPKETLAPIVNVTPEAGQSAEFALENRTPLAVPLLTAHLIRTSEGGVEHYSFAIVSKEVPQVALSKFELTFWGVPADPSHDAMRGRVCAKFEAGPVQCEGGGESAGVSQVPFLSMPTNCTAGPESTTIRTDSWQEPGTVEGGGHYSSQYTQESFPFSAVTGCELLAFKAGTGVGLEPENQLADEPVGLGVSLKVPLNEEPGTNTAPLLRATRVTLPEGMSISSGVVDGIQACNATGPEGINITGPESEQVGEDGELHLAPGHCPDASTVGTAEAITPYLPVPVKGHVYLARPGCGNAALGQAPCTTQDALDGNLYRLYLELGGTGELANTGIEFKVPLETQANPATGQLTTNASELVQAPYNEVRIHLNGGPRAPIANPPQCGPAVTNADLSPWSAPGTTPEGALVTGTPDSLSSSSFEVQGCPNPKPFSPGFVAGTVTPQAGQFSSFTMNLSRQDREQYVHGIQLHTPPGLLAMLSSVPLCQEAAANAGACPEASKIGTTRVATGAGSHPFEIEGAVYLTGPYHGAPFGLSIATHVVAGPFNLGLVVVRARIDIDPSDSTATITTDESGPYAVPQIVFGVPVRLQRITVDVDRPGFMFNPTNCKAMQVSAKISGNQQAVANLSSPFAVGGCKSLAFKPKFGVSTAAHTSRAKGASLDAKVSYPAGAFGSDANIARVKVSLPKLMPSRLSTLQKACPAARFAANPAACPPGSIVGIARTRTPLLPVKLEGPVYFVSHGGEAFPSLVIVLEGDNVRVDLTGNTFINEKTSVTTSTFKAVPDVPVDSFELYLPQGPYSALAAVGNLCKEKSKLKMPTELVAQNGLVFKQSTQIQVNGCTSKNPKKARTGHTTTHANGRGGAQR